MEITTLGIDLAKSVFQLHGTDAGGRVVLRKRLRRNQVLEFMVQKAVKDLQRLAVPSAYTRWRCS